jgi:hypothetical protein
VCAAHALADLDKVALAIDHLYTVLDVGMILGLGTRIDIFDVEMLVYKLQRWIFVRPPSSYLKPPMHFNYGLLISLVLLT